MPDQPYWIHLLDMGHRKYGDSIFIDHPELRVLIDGGYGALARDQPDVQGLPSQLDECLRLGAGDTESFPKGPPFEIDLLVVTHCHGDHVGCLPRLVEERILRPKWALVGDPDHAFPELPASDSKPLPTALADLAAIAVREEPHDDLDDEELLAYLEDAATLESRYRKMLEGLRAGGCQVVRYGRDSVSEFRRFFEPRGLEILGPTRAHLKRCRNFLLEQQARAVERAAHLATDHGDHGAARAELYRRLLAQLPVEDAAIEEDRAGRGSALNNQSIVLRFESGGASALFTGDMQLAAPEVPGLDGAMGRLLDKLAAQAPYDFLKVAHHASYNGFDEAVFERLPAQVYGHTGGQRSASHPHRDVLRLLRDRARDREWVRTDRNGRVGIALGYEPIRLYLASGHQNDYRLSPAADSPVPPEQATSRGTPTAEPAPLLRAPQVESRATEDMIEVVARVPHTRTRVTLTIEVEPLASEPVNVGLDGATTSSHRAPTMKALEGVPRQLFVTSHRLGEAIGSESEARAILDGLRAAGQEVVVEVPTEVERAREAAAIVQERLRSLEKSGQVFGVVLLGNYDVVPAVALDVLDANLRRSVTLPDQDRFVVWSDDPFGDLDSDGVPDLPVSRVLHEPGSAELLLQSLASSRRQGGQRFGVRNVNRPFAEAIFDVVPGDGPLHVSAPTEHHVLDPRDDQGAHDYFMLHGSADDATVFWGESDDDIETVEAFQIGNVPAVFHGVVLAGCCWGALPVTEPAGWRATGQPVIPRTRQSSISIRYLAAGARAFVGCTGTHYSPGEEPYSYFGAPFHEVFWFFISEGYPPALALLQTKRHYAASIPHIAGSPGYTAIELKILQQFTCLGLGW